MNDKIFFDSNIFVYSVDSKNPEKMKVAQNLISEASNEGNAIISTQNLQEFYNATTKKLLRDKNDDYSA